MTTYRSRSLLAPFGLPLLDRSEELFTGTRIKNRAEGIQKDDCRRVLSHEVASSLYNWIRQVFPVDLVPMMDSESRVHYGTGGSLGDTGCSVA